MSCVKTVKVAAGQMPEIREDVGRAITWMQTCLAEADFRGFDLLCFPECYLQGYLTDYPSAKKHALDLNSVAFKSLLTQFSRFRCMFVFGIIEIERGGLFNSAVVVHQAKVLGRYRKTRL